MQKCLYFEMSDVTAFVFDQWDFVCDAAGNVKKIHLHYLQEGCRSFRDHLSLVSPVTAPPMMMYE